MTCETHGSSNDNNNNNNNGCRVRHAATMLMYDALSHTATSRFQIAGDCYTVESKDQF